MGSTKALRGRDAGHCRAVESLDHLGSVYWGTEICRQREWDGDKYRRGFGGFPVVERP